MQLTYRGVRYEVNLPSAPAQPTVQPAANAEPENQRPMHHSSRSDLINQQPIKQAPLAQNVAKPPSQPLSSPQKVSSQTMEHDQIPPKKSGFSLRTITHFFKRERILKPMVIQAYNHQEVTYWYKGNQVRLILNASGEVVQSAIVRSKDAG